MSDCMCTYTGLLVNPMNIQDGDIRTEDIAHALSLLCRGGGHMKQLYTVGQHCLNCTNEAKARGWNFIGISARCASSIPWRISAP